MLLPHAILYLSVGEGGIQMKRRVLITFVILMIALSGCSKKVSLVGSYELLSISMGEEGSTRTIDPSDFTLKLIINPDGKYLLSEIENRKLQHEMEGEYTIEKNQISFTNFILISTHERVAVFDFIFENDLLSLKIISFDGKSENVPAFTWTFKRS
ncbi:MAG: hypothetical protein H8E00_01080 [Deltaproteobacteria bacterium]|nr:hypothetical protein [Deltaproteobacteria bacterium]